MLIRMFQQVADNGDVTGVRALARLAGAKEADGTTWQQLAYEGEWHGHGAGSFQFNREVFDALVANFARRDDDVPIVHGHPGVNSDQAAYLGAAGWISELRIDEDDKGRVGLFGRVKWTERTASKIKADEYRYCSVVVAFESIDEVTGDPIGPELLELGIVPAAFLDGMTPLAASRANRTTPAPGGTNTTRSLSMNTHDILNQARKDLPEDASIEQVTAYLEAEAAKAKAMAGESADDAAPAEEPAAEAELSDVPADDAQTVEASDTPAEVAAMDEPMPDAEADAATAESGVSAIVDSVVGMGGTADVTSVAAFLQENADAIGAQFLGAPDEGTPADDMAAMSIENKVLSRKVEKLEATVAELSKAKADAEDAAVAAKVDDAIESSIFEESERDEMIALGRTHPKQLDTLIRKHAGPKPPRALHYKPAAPDKGMSPEAAEAQTEEEREFVARLERSGKKGAAVVTRLALFRDELAKKERRASR